MEQIILAFHVMFLAGCVQTTRLLAKLAILVIGCLLMHAGIRVRLIILKIILLGHAFSAKYGVFRLIWICISPMLQTPKFLLT